MWNFNPKKALHNLKELDKKWAKKIQDKFNLTDYQMLCLAFAKGFIIGAIILQIYMKPIKWSAQILLGSNRLTKVEFVTESNLREDALQRCKAMYGVSDVRQLKREW